MKKLLATISALAMGVALVHAQGGILSWQNPNAGVSTNSVMYAPDYPSTNGEAITGKTPAISYSAQVLYYFILLSATSTNAQDEGNPLGTDWSVMTYEAGGVSYGTNFATAGSATGTAGTTGFASNLNAATSYFDMVVGWSANLGNSWATVEGELEGNSWTAPGFFGYSDVGSIIPTSAPANGASIFSAGSAANGQTLLYVVPEPTTLALAGLGGLSMLFLRRRKA